MSVIRFINIIHRVTKLVPAFSIKNNPTGIQTGDVVTVLSYGEILRTLDEHNCCEGLLFMPNMRQYCTRQFKVLKRVKWIYNEKYRKILSCKDIVVLSGAICDGKGMLPGIDCDRMCTLFWKTAWLKKNTSLYAHDVATCDIDEFSSRSNHPVRSNQETCTKL